MSGRESFRKHKAFISALKKTSPLAALNFFDFLLRTSESRVSLLIRYLKYSKIMFKCGDSAFFGGMITIKNPQKITLGNNFSLHAYCYLDGAGLITIGDDVSIAHNCSLVSFEHTWDNLSIPIKYNPTKTSKITIGNDVWLGCGVRVLAGSVINDRVVVAAGAVVKGELESGFLYAGVPAKKIKPIHNKQTNSRPTAQASRIRLNAPA